MLCIFHAAQDMFSFLTVGMPPALRTRSACSFDKKSTGMLDFVVCPRSCVSSRSHKAAARLGGVQKSSVAYVALTDGETSLSSNGEAMSAMFRAGGSMFSLGPGVPATGREGGVPEPDVSTWAHSRNTKSAMSLGSTWLALRASRHLSSTTLCRALTAFI